MKKMLALVLSLTIACTSLTACGSKKEKEKEKSEDTSSAEKVYEPVTVNEITFPSEAKVERTDKSDSSASLDVNDGKYHIQVFYNELDSIIWSQEDMERTARAHFVLTECYETIETYEDAISYDCDISEEIINGFTVFEISADGKTGYSACRDYGNYKYQITLYDSIISGEATKFYDDFKKLIELIKLE